jgi:SsrA-binding protein
MSIVENRKASHDYFIEERYEAGLALEGWEVKSIRAGRAQLAEAYVIVRNEELFLIGCHISRSPPLPPTSSRSCNPQAFDAQRGDEEADRQSRARRLHDRPLNLHYRGGWIKLEMGL